MRASGPSIGGLILAAGESRRMGRPKALLDYGGRSFLAWGVALLRDAQCEPIIVVEGAHPLRDLAGELGEVDWARNVDWQLGPLSSLQVGLARALALAPTLEALFVHHVERPRVRARTLQALRQSLGHERECCWQPQHQGRSGHPLLLPRAIFPAIAPADPQAETLRSILRSPAWAPRRRLLAVEDPGVLDNIDSPEDLAKLPPPWQELPDG